MAAQAFDQFFAAALPASTQTVELASLWKGAFPAMIGYF
jgi:hypothetical protein